MKPGTKFAIGAVVIVASVSLMISEGIKTTGTYFLTPTQLVERVEQDSTLHDVGLKVSAKVVRGTIKRNSATQQVDFTISDGRTPSRWSTWALSPTPSPTKRKSMSWSRGSSVVTGSFMPRT